MKARVTQLNALVSTTTKELLEEYSRKTGVKKAFLIEQAVRRELEALKELPATILVPPRVIVSRASGERIAKRLAGKKAPTASLKALLRDADPTP